MESDISYILNLPELRISQGFNLRISLIYVKIISILEGRLFGVFSVYQNMSEI